MSVFKPKDITILWAIAVLLSSCASILNGPVQKIRIAGDPGIKIISVDTPDSSVLKSDKQGNYYIQRGNTPISVNVRMDSINKTIILKSHLSVAFWFNLYCNYGLGMLVDRNNPKRFGYPPNTYLQIKDTSVKYARRDPLKKGSVNFSFSLPFATIFYMKSDIGKRKSAGIIGVETGLDYFYDNNRYVSLNLGAASDRFGEYFGKGYMQAGNALFASVRANHMIGDFDLGYGISVSQLRWANVTLGDTTNMDHSIRNNTAGLSLSANWRIRDRFGIGILYQPGIVSLGSQPVLDYQHYISLNFTWKGRLRQGR